MMPDTARLGDIVIDRTAGESELGGVASEIADTLKGLRHFCVWLYGDLGAGKTTLVREVLRCLGLPSIIPVTSPTFTYVNEYDVGGGRRLAHLDLYRLNDQGPLDVSELGIDEDHGFCGFFVEWPGAVCNEPILAPSHALDISFLPNSGSSSSQPPSREWPVSVGSDGRRYRLFRAKS